MGQFIRNLLPHGVTVISNEFIDKHMAGANGEYVKVYLCILRNGGAVSSAAKLADELNSTEADVRRALVYWERAGLLELSDNAVSPEPGNQPGQGYKREAALQDGGCSAAAGRELPAAGSSAFPRAEAPAAGRPSGNAVLCGLNGNEEFSQLLYIAQKYLNRTFTPTDCDVFANLYGNLRMPAELLEYLVESCAQNGHTSIRYIEKVGLSWHERGFKTAEEAKTQSAGYKRDIFAVMKAFGLSGRNPANGEIALMDKWFGAFGFTREIVVEACSRTMAAIHKPSFQYADTILTEWSRLGVRTMRDVEEADRLRKENRKAAGASGRAGAQGSGAGLTGNGGTGGAGGASLGYAAKSRSVQKRNNRFHNLEEHGYDYDEMIWNMISRGEACAGQGEEAPKEGGPKAKDSEAYKKGETHIPAPGQGGTGTPRA